MAKKRVLSGIRTSGNIHLGIYIGSISQWLARQAEDNYENWYFVADLHGITTPYDPKKLKELTMEAVMLYLACGLDPEKSTIFIQSHIPAHSELQWLLSCNTPMSWMNQMIQYKEKSQNESEDSVTLGLFAYPVLMAADILLYQTDLVPVGQDQSQHVEIAREIARRFNRLNGQTFKEPDVLLLKEGAKIMGLDNPEKKMSKSAKSKYNYINLLDSFDDVRQKIKKAVTDAGQEIKFNEDNPAINNLLTIYQLVTSEEKDVIENKFTGKGYADFKEDLAEKIIEFLRPIQTKYAEFDKNRDYVMELMAHGAAKASAVANQTLYKAQKSAGLLMPISPVDMKEKPAVSYDDWQKLDVEIGEIKQVNAVEGADKLYKLAIDFGDKGETEIIAGIREFFKPDDLVGKQVPILRNLAEKEIRGAKSRGMILAVDEDGTAILLNPGQEVKLGSKIS